MTGRPRRWSTSKDKGTTKQGGRRLDTVNMQFMDKGLLCVKKCGFTRVKNIKSDVSSCGTGIGQARNYEHTLQRRIKLPLAVIRAGWMSQSYDGAVHHDGVPELVRELFGLSAFHVAVHDANHSINLGVEHSYKTGSWKIVTRSASIIINLFRCGSNFSLDVQNESVCHDLNFVSVVSFSATKWVSSN